MRSGKLALLTTAVVFSLSAGAFAETLGTNLYTGNTSGLNTPQARAEAVATNPRDNSNYPGFGPNTGSVTGSGYQEGPQISGSSGVDLGAPLPGAGTVNSGNYPGFGPNSGSVTGSGVQQGPR